MKDDASMTINNISSTGLRALWLTLLVLGLDRASKLWIIYHLNFFDPLQILPIFNLTLTYNTGAAFSFLHSAGGWQNIFLGSLAVFVSGIILYWLYKSSYRERLLNAALALVLGGALGNLWDRLLYHHVIDFFDFHYGAWHFAIFNVADSAICVGGFLLCIHWALDSFK